MTMVEARKWLKRLEIEVSANRGLTEIMKKITWDFGSVRERG